MGNPPQTPAAQPKQRSELENRMLRLAADFENYKKRVQRDRQEERTRDKDALFSEWFEVIDNVERALASDRQDSQALYEGLGAIHRQMMAILERHDIHAVRPANQRFDPTAHEAVACVSAPNTPAGQVIHVDRTGYVRPGRVVRPARVVVSDGG